MKNQRISIQLPLPSVSLQNFLEKLLQDERFFSLAIENPLNAMKKCGLNVETKTFTIQDFSTFFGAVAGLKDALKETDQKTLDFESIFGKPAEIRGSVLEAERFQGFYKEWDNRDALVDKQICRTTNRLFQVDRDRSGQKLTQTVREKMILALQNQDVKISHYTQIQRDLISTTMESSETNNHTRTEWNTDTVMQSNTRSERGVNKNFEGISMIEDIMQGPLINPVDLASVTARLEVFTQMLRQ
ncbi:MAG: hypothetical protein ABIJ31_08545 [Pseudomonadota bacterium]